MIAYISSSHLRLAADQLPSNIGRSSIVHSLTDSLDLIEKADGDDVKKARLVEPDPNLAQREQLLRYHTPAYVDYLLSEHRDDISIGDIDSDSSSSSGSSRPRKRARTEKHGFEHDCPPFPSLPKYALQVAGATLTACRLLARGEASITINWDGGRHHALRSRASGFCYVADAVLGIMLLTREGKVRDPSKKRRPRVMYIDMDLHYGDGVALAFHSPTSYPATLPPGRKLPKPPQVLTLSVHHSSPTFFPPPTPLSLLPTADTPSPFSLSIPLRAYPSSSTYASIFLSIQNTYEAFRPDYIVLQLGADGLPGDPIGQFGNWSTGELGGMIWLAKKVKEWGVPLCILGGGGYNSADTARAWAGVTAAMLEREISEDIPHHDHFPEYAPSFTIGVSEGSVKDENTAEHIAEINDRFEVIAARIRELVDA